MHAHFPTNPAAVEPLSRTRPTCGMRMTSAAIAGDDELVCDCARSARPSRRPAANARRLSASLARRRPQRCARKRAPRAAILVLFGRDERKLRASVRRTGASRTCCTRRASALSPPAGVVARGLRGRRVRVPAVLPRLQRREQQPRALRDGRPPVRGLPGGARAVPARRRRAEGRGRHARRRRRARGPAGPAPLRRLVVFRVEIPRGASADGHATVVRAASTEIAARPRAAALATAAAHAADARTLLPRRSRRPPPGPEAHVLRRRTDPTPAAAVRACGLNPGATAGRAAGGAARAATPTCPAQPRWRPALKRRGSSALLTYRMRWRAARNKWKIPQLLHFQLRLIGCSQNFDNASRAAADPALATSAAIRNRPNPRLAAARLAREPWVALDRRRDLMRQTIRHRSGADLSLQRHRSRAAAGPEMHNPPAAPARRGGGRLVRHNARRLDAERSDGKAAASEASGHVSAGRCEIGPRTSPYSQRFSSSTGTRQQPIFSRGSRARAPIPGSLVFPGQPRGAHRRPERDLRRRARGRARARTSQRIRV